MTYDQNPTTIRDVDSSCVEKMVGPTAHSPDTMLTVFFAVDAMVVLGIRQPGD
jgi:hypothetical protein